MVLGFRYSHGQHRGSVFPKIELGRTAEGTRVYAQLVGWKDALKFWFLAIFVASFVILAVMLATSPQKRVDAFFALTAASGVVIEMGRRYYRQRRLKSATLLVRPWPLRLGQRAKLRFDKRLKKRAHVDGLTAQLTCTEEATTSMGKYQKIDRRTRYQVALDTTNAIVRPGWVQDEWEIEIPSNGLPSFSVKSNKVQWRIETVTDTDGTGVTADFELLVIPEVVAS